ncbi:hypothetical protein GCM10010289_79290 [Streptomyces violascens]|uniref:Uncharacterized protein n=1 Tax=Streptomyces violascens TaxID=67381 RepID=A0ABQ3QEX9_9ACTN|nr:hypothetical protein GCM10010289_79290 [Streptomyces violascens]GHI35846.1 hypothetical protein Sviol_02540 [Streptomyces violascens]
MWSLSESGLRGRVVGEAEEVSAHADHGVAHPLRIVQSGAGESAVVQEHHHVARVVGVGVCPAAAANWVTVSWNQPGARRPRSGKQLEDMIENRRSQALPCLSSLTWPSPDAAACLRHLTESATQQVR